MQVAVSTDCASLVLAGEGDKLTPPRCGQAVAAEINHSACYTIAQAGKLSISTHAASVIIGGLEIERDVAHAARLVAVVVPVQ